MTLVGKVTTDKTYIMKQLSDKDQIPIRTFVTKGDTRSGVRFSPGTHRGASFVSVSESGDAFVKVFKDSLTDGENDQYRLLLAPIKKLIQGGGIEGYLETDHGIFVKLPKEILAASKHMQAKKDLEILFRTHGVLPIGWEKSEISSYYEPAVGLLEETMRHDLEAGELKKLPTSYYVDFLKNVIVREKST